MWLRGKGTLKKEDQQYNEWMRAKLTRQTRKLVAVISSSSRSQAPWGRKYKSPTGSKNGHSDDDFSASSKNGSKSVSASTMKTDQQMNEVIESKIVGGGSSKGNEQFVRDDNEGQSENYSSRIERGVVGLTLKEVRLVVLVQMLA